MKQKNFRTQEENSMIMKKIMENRSLEQKSASAKKGWETRRKMDPMTGTCATKKGWANRTVSGSESAKKGWETRRKKDPNAGWKIGQKGWETRREKKMRMDPTFFES